MCAKKKIRRKVYEELISLSSYENVYTKEAFDHLALLIDFSFDLQENEGLSKSLAFANELSERQLNSTQKALLFYYFGNAWGNIRILKAPKSSKEHWKWEQEELENEIFYFRSSLMEPGFENLPLEIRCMVLTNLANIIDTIGRFIDAIELWDKALDINSEFGMALGNKGMGLQTYASAVYDPGHRNMLMKQSYVYLTKALTQSANKLIHPSAKKSFTKIKNDMKKNYPSEFFDHECNLTDYSLGDSSEEQTYRKWCLENRLFLNPLNDLGAYPISAQDIITTPNMVTPLDVGPRYQGYFNQIKQEFVSARYLLYEGINSKEVHFSDKNVLLYNTLDYPVYSFAIERVKLALRSAYSLFDKFAYFLNEYLEIGIPQREVNFRNIWYKDPKKRILRSQFENKKNLPLRALFWLSKDLFEDKPGFKDLVEHDAQNINKIRNHLEHKYLKVHEMESYITANITKGLVDDLAFSVSKNEFISKALRTMKLARSALIYLSLAIQAEEIEREKQRDPKKIIMPIVQDTWDDDWKR
ncbi:MAG: LA2681 family HEPN domain-containing protein [Anaerolineales bacterium]|jgi:hypothetical protein